jgi:hypothetical protein
MHIFNFERGIRKSLGGRGEGEVTQYGGSRKPQCSHVSVIKHEHVRAILK